MTIAEPVSFSQVLRERSWELHQRAEGTTYLQALMDGRLDLEGYAAMVAQEWYVYAELDAAAAAHRDDPIAGPFLSPELARVGRLEADLQFLLGTGWREAITPVPATTRYTDRIREVAADWPSGVVAHHYTRYLGDLSGGQAIARIVARHYGFADGDGVRSYEFPGVGNVKAFKDTYRERLDAAPWSPDERQRVIDEVLLAYRLNTEMFADLAGRLGLTAES